MKMSNSPELEASLMVTLDPYTLRHFFVTELLGRRHQHWRCNGSPGTLGPGDDAAVCGRRRLRAVTELLDSKDVEMPK